MRHASVTRQEAPDPREHLRDLLSRLPVPLVGLVAQPHIENPLPAINSGSSRTGIDRMEVSLSYTLLRNPADRDAPENLAQLDDETRWAFEAKPTLPRPAWVVEMVDRMEHTELWEAVRTSWHFDVDPARAGVDAILCAHVDHVLRNRFAEETGWSGRFGDPMPPGDVTPASIQHGVPLRLDGIERKGIKIDTDPFVFGIGAQLDRHTVVTAVVPRDALDIVVLEFTTQESVSAQALIY